MTTTLDRARGVLLGGVVGDALGAGYETDKVRPGPDGPRMIGGGIGPRSPGEWTDDTAMAWCIADVAARRLDLANDEGLTAVARNFRAWFDSNPPDIGTQTQRALSGGGPYPTAAELTASAEKVARARGTSAGNGSLMRTGPVALQFLDDPDGCATAAAAISRLTHANDTAVQACVLWTEAIRTAITTGTLDIRSGLHHLPHDAHTTWATLLDDAEQQHPSTFRPNGYVVTALQAAWSSIHHTTEGREGPDHVRAALTTVIAIGDDTDTTAAIAGALLGARWGATAIPTDWANACHGYPGLTGHQLAHLADHATQPPHQEPEWTYTIRKGAGRWPFRTYEATLLQGDAVETHTEHHSRRSAELQALHWETHLGAKPA